MHNTAAKDEPKNWYTSGNQIVPEYARALLSAEFLLERYGITQIPHWSHVASTYQDLLDGNKVSVHII